MEPKLVVFDLDETITRHDTLLPYALGFLLRKRPWRAPLLLAVVPGIIGFLRGRSDEGRIKQAFIKATLGGSRRAVIEAWTARFIPRLLKRGMFTEALERVAEHRRQRDYLVLMSASTDLYVPAIARELGFNETICTQVRWTGDRAVSKGIPSGDDILEGSLITPNRKGEEKARCFADLQARHPGVQTIAYGNSSTDLPHLRLASQGILVNGSAKARHAAQSFGVSCIEWN